MRASLLDRGPQGRAAGEQVVLPDELLEPLRAYPRRQRPPRPAGVPRRLRLLLEQPVHAVSIAAAVRAAGESPGGCPPGAVEPIGSVMHAQTLPGCSAMSAGAGELLPEAGGGLDFLDVAPGGAAVVARSPLQLFWRRFRRDRIAMASLVFVAFVTVIAVAAPLVVKLLGLPGPDVENPNLTNAFGAPARAELGASRSASTSSART